MSLYPLKFFLFIFNQLNYTHTRGINLDIYFLKLSMGSVLGSIQSDYKISQTMNTAVLNMINYSGPSNPVHILFFKIFHQSHHLKCSVFSA